MVWNEHDNCLGVLSEYLTQTSITEEERGKEDKDKVTVSLSVWEAFEENQDEAWTALPPKRRREILDEARIELITTPGGSAKKAEDRQEKEAMISQKGSLAYL